MTSPDTRLRLFGMAILLRRSASAQRSLNRVAGSVFLGLAARPQRHAYC